MEQEASKKSKVLPDNAYTPLEPGEEYVPVVPADKIVPEVTKRSVIMGLIMVVLFTFAAAYIGLKTGNVIEASIPIAILAVFFGKMFARVSTLPENVIVQSLGQASGVVVAGAVFTIPALYINQLQPSFLQIFIACALGGFLGVVLLIPLRRYFCRDEHGKLPFPEATAITEILASGEASGKSQGRTLIKAFALGFAFDLIVEFVHLWNLHLNTKVLLGRAGQFLSDLRFELKLNAAAAYFGLGYIIGVKYAAIISAGSVLSFLILVPLVYLVGSHLEVPLMPPATDTLIKDMDAATIFGLYVRPIGIGCIAVAGFMGIIKMGKIIIGSMSLAFKGLTGKAEEGETVRTDTDMKAKNTMLIQIATVIVMFLFFWWVAGTLKVAIIGTIVTYVLAFLFTPVAARAIAIVGVNPVSGMTLITLIIACIILASVGLGGGAEGQTVALIIGCTVCTALSTSGAFVSDLKIGYWLGAKPRNQQALKFLGIIVAAAAVGGVIWVLANSFGFTIVNDAGQRVANPDLPAPQGNLMAAIVSGLLGGEQPPIILYCLGGLAAVFLEMAGVPALAFGLGMYLPIQINMAILSGGIAAHFIGKSGKTPEIQKARKDQGILIASGIMAGAAIVGTIGAILMLKEIGEPIMAIDVGHRAQQWYHSWGSQFVGFLAFIGLALGAFWLAKNGAEAQMAEEKEMNKE